MRGRRDAREAHGGVRGALRLYLVLCDSMEGGIAAGRRVGREDRRAFRPMALQGRLPVHVGAPPASFRVRAGTASAPRIFRRDGRAALIMRQSP